MPVEIKRLSGNMDQDSSNESIEPHNHREAWNLSFNGPKGNERAEIIDGNILIPGQSFLPPGVNKTIGHFYDEVYLRIFYLNCNSNGNHAIYILNTLTQTFQTLIACGPLTPNDSGVLGFTFNSSIDSIDIFYGDPINGDILEYVDSLGRPTQISIQGYLANTYSVIKRTYIDVIKPPPRRVPVAVYENDTTVNANLCSGTVFTFALAYYYDNSNQSILSSGSRMTFPVNTVSNVTSLDKSLDARIALFLPTGDVNVNKLVIYMKRTQNGSTSDYLIVDTIDKTASGIASNSVYKYLFFNNGNYVPDDTTYTTSEQDYTPDDAGCGCIANGDTLIYGDITEGYDWQKTTWGNQLLINPAGDNINGFAYLGYTNGIFTGTQPHMLLIVAGAGTNDPVTGIPTVVTDFPSFMSFNAVSSTNGDVSFSSTIANSGNLQAMLTQMSSAAVIAGWTIVSQGVANGYNYLEIYYPTGTIALKSTYYTGGGFATDPTTRPALYPQSNYAWGVKYFDSNGKGVGVLTDITANIATLPVGAAPGFLYARTGVKLNLNGIIPPSWAVSWAPVRTDTLTYSYYLDWITNAAFSNIGQLVDNQYAYLGISNIDDFNTAIQASQNVVVYGFVQGQRVRITSQYPIQGPPFYGMTFDYPILGEAIDPIINGLVKQGRFLKIAYPTADVNGSTNLKFNGDPNFQNYQITIYNVASNTAPQTEANAGSTEDTGNVFYEVGYKFGIGNQGQSNAYHFGNIADNVVQIQDGDIFFRSRTIPSGQTFYFYSGNAAYSNRYVTYPTTPGQSFTSSAYTIGALGNNICDPFNAGVYPTLGDSGGLIYNTSGGNLNVRLRGTVTAATSGGDTWMDILCKITAPGNVITNPYLLVHSESINTGAPAITITFDGTVVVPNGAKLWLIFGNGNTVENLTVNGFLLQMDVIQNITIQCFDKSYSDIYLLQANSDNRPAVSDATQKRTEYVGMYRWGQQNQLGTARNNSNRFYYSDFDNTPGSNGAIVRLTVQGKLMHIFQERKLGTAGIFQQYQKTNSGSNELILSETIITKNNIHYEIYDGGIGNQGSSVVISNYAHYLVDPVKGYVLRWSRDGVIAISLLYKSQTWAGNNLPNYLNSYTNQFGGDARILGTFKILKGNNSKYYLMAQSGTNAAGQSIDGRVLVFDETDNGFEGFHNIDCDRIVNAQNDLYQFYGGAAYISNTNAVNANFFGVQYPSSIDLVFNPKEPMKKQFLALSYQANQYFVSPNFGDVNTSLINPQTGLQQQSSFIIQDGEIQENEYYFPFNRDANSMQNPNVALLEGDYLMGNWLMIHLEYAGGGPGFLFAPYVTYIPSNRNF